MNREIKFRGKRENREWVKATYSAAISSRYFVIQCNTKR